MSPLNRAQDEARTVGIFAHPDDEILALGGALQSMPSVDLVIATDGAPPWVSNPVAHGAMRRSESERALLLTGMAHRLHWLAFQDQGLAASAFPLLSALCDHVAHARTIYTHAFEHGHPDHDALCLVVHAAARRFNPDTEIIECPLYRNEVGQLVISAWDTDATTLSPAVSTLKREMIACFQSQQNFLVRFPEEREVFRRAPIRGSEVSACLPPSFPEGVPTLAREEDWIHLASLLEHAG